ncbi:MAG: Ni,Fe-hydrogenase I large subunit [Bdellovibrio bacteriovorus]
MSDPAGRLQIRIDPNGAVIDSSRPWGAARIFVGRGPAETARLLPTLFSICATAQSAACAGALEEAQGLASSPTATALRQRLVDAETLREHLWRILLDWPRFLDLGPDAPAMAAVMEVYARLRSALIQGQSPFEPGAFAPGWNPEVADRPAAELAALVRERVLGMGPAEWLASIRGFDALAAWCERTDTVAARVLERILAQGLEDLGRCEIGALPAEPDLAELDALLGGPEAEDFVARPSWGGEPREASPLTRNLEFPLIQDLSARLGNGILTRLAAQLLEVARIMSGEQRVAGGGEPLFRARVPGAASVPRGPGVGMSQVAAARGPLVHRAHLAEGRILDYRILAPTEWNFHPRGVVSAGLDAMVARLDGAELGPLARLFIAAVDPCVDFDLLLT